MTSIEDRNSFAERLRLQLQSRYRNHNFSVEPARFAIRITGAGVDATLALTPLYNAAQREPQRTSTLIADFVRSAEGQLQAQPGAGFSTARVLWCVRSQSYLEEMSRADELLRREVAGDMVAFVAEALPGSIMRGVPRSEWQHQGHGDAEVVAAADRNTAERFATVGERVLRGERVPRDGWQFAGDVLFAGSALLVPSVLRAFADRAGGDVLLAVPDRSLLMAIPAASPAADRFQRRVVQAYREAMTPCSRDVLVTDGSNLRLHARADRLRDRPKLLAWLQD